MTESNVLQLVNIVESSMLTAGEGASLVRVDLEQLLGVVDTGKMLQQETWEWEALQAG